MYINANRAVILNVWQSHITRTERKQHAYWMQQHIINKLKFNLHVHLWRLAMIFNPLIKYSSPCHNWSIGFRGTVGRGVYGLMLTGSVHYKWGVACERDPWVYWVAVSTRAHCFLWHSSTDRSKHWNKICIRYKEMKAENRMRYCCSRAKLQLVATKQKYCHKKPREVSRSF